MVEETPTVEALPRTEETTVMIVLPSVSTVERYVGQMRWRGPVLQQAVEVLTFRGARPISRVVDWRDVPQAEV